METTDTPINETIPVLTERDFDAMLAEARKEYQERNKPKYSMPEVLGEYRAIKEKPGLYLRPMCLEIELRGLELYGIYSDGTAAGLARVAAGVAAAALFKVTLPANQAEAMERIGAYLRGDVPEEEMFEPLTEAQVGRLFRNSEELQKLVLDPLDISLLRKDDAEESSGNS